MFLINTEDRITLEAPDIDFREEAKMVASQASKAPTQAIGWCESRALLWAVYLSGQDAVGTDKSVYLPGNDARPWATVI